MKIGLKMKRTLLLATKIGVGVSGAIFLAELLELRFATSAGTIALLTMMTTKWGTFRLSMQRLLTYIMSVGLCWIIFNITPSVWVGLGVLLFGVVIITELLGWRGTLSVNAVIGTHFLTTQDFSLRFMLNEFLLILLGITIAVVLNLFHINNAHENGIIRRMRKTEEEMKKILRELAGYLEQRASGEGVWDDLIGLEKNLEEYLELAYEYHNNTFHTHQKYYIAYFEMRLKQCGALHNLHSEMIRMREMPKQARVVAEYVLDIVPFLTEMNDPIRQIEELKQILNQLRNEPLPISHEEFENRAELYHVLMDLEEFLLYKKRFVEEIDETQFRIYWNRAINRES